MGKKAKKKVRHKQDRIPSSKDKGSAASSAPGMPNGQPIRAKDLWAWLLIGLIVFINYGNTLGNDFVHDDRIEILQNPFIQDFSHLTKILFSPAWAFRSDVNEQVGSNYYRPVQYLTYTMLYHFLGPSPMGYHLFKLLLHLAVCILLFRVIYRYWKNYSLGLLSALLFAVHPANTEAVSWISGITDVTSALFLLLTLLFYLKYKCHPSLVTLLGCYLFFFIGLFAKETMVTFIPILFLYEWIHSKKIPSLKHWVRIYLPLLLGFFVYLAMRIYAIGSFASPGQLRYDFLNAFQSFLNQVTLLSKYFETSFFPVSLNAYHVFDPILKLTDYRFGVAFSMLAIILSLFWLICKRMESQHRRLMLFGLLWFFLALSPVLIFLKRIGENVFAERYLYVPLLGLCLSVSVPLVRIREKMPRVMNPLLVILLSLFSWKVIDRNKIWRDELTFYETTAQASPPSSTILNNLGYVYAGQARYEEALKALEASIAIKPNLAAYKNLGQIYAARGRLDDSVAAYEQAAAMHSRDAGIYSGLGDTYFAQQRYSEAISAYQKSLALNPKDSRVCFNLADAYVNEKRYVEALATYETALSLSPKEAARAYRGMGTVYTAQNLLDKAAAAIQKAFASNP